MGDGTGSNDDNLERNAGENIIQPSSSKSHKEQHIGKLEERKGKN